MSQSETLLPASPWSGSGLIHVLANLSTIDVGPAARPPFMATVPGAWLRRCVSGKFRKRQNGIISMTNRDEDLLRMVRRNKLLGKWAAEKLGLAGESAEAYSNDLAIGTIDFERSDVLSKIRKDFK